jgi:hypothetical protein
VANVIPRALTKTMSINGRLMSSTTSYTTSVPPDLTVGILRGLSIVNKRFAVMSLPVAPDDHAD